MLNATMCAVSRTICAILENYQTDEGVVIPEALRPYFPKGMEMIKFVKTAPIEEAKVAESKRQQKKKNKGKSASKDGACLESKMDDLSVDNN